MPASAYGIIGMAVIGAVPSVRAQESELRSADISDIHYDVTYDAAMARRNAIHVRMSFTASDRDSVVLSLPAWTPGSYELDNFARYVSGFSVASADGQAVPWNKADYDTWVVRPPGAGPLQVNFDFTADTLDTGISWMAPDLAFFNGTNLFLYPEGHGFDGATRVTIHTEPGWRVATGLTPGEGAFEFTAKTYHELVDMPTLVGTFDLDSAEVDGTWYRLATYPAGTLAGTARSDTWDAIRRMMPPMAAVFGEVPFSSYTILMVFDAEYPGGSAFEHQNSHLGIYATQFIGTPVLASITAHEIFHAWNVKRLRPMEMVPYRYDRAEPTTLLWVSEGITDYYADLALVRGGVISPNDFYAITAGKAGTVAGAAPVSLEDASVSTWIEPTDGTYFLYYPKGSLIGFLLDILIRDASDNLASLDDVMRDLYQRTYKHGTGFTTFDWWLAVGRATGQKSFEDFYSRYIRGRDPLPFADVLPRAGLRLRSDSVEVPRLGVSTAQDSAGVFVTTVTPGSTADDAGVVPGDYLRAIGDVDVRDQGFGDAFRRRSADSTEGLALPIAVRRGPEDVILDAQLQFAIQVQTVIEEDPAADEKAVRIRNGIIRGEVGR